MFDIGKDSKPPITGLEFRRIPNTDKYVIILTTLIRIYQYMGVVSSHEEKPLLQQVFSKYLNIKGEYRVPLFSVFDEQTFEIKITVSFLNYLQNVSIS